jgi:hypothetical protein
VPGAAGGIVSSRCGRGAVGEGPCALVPGVAQFCALGAQGALEVRDSSGSILRKKPLPEEPEAVPAAAWLFQKGLKPEARLWESAVALPAYDAVLSLLVLREVVAEAE